MTSKQALVRALMLGYFAEHGEYPASHHVAQHFSLSIQAAWKHIKRLIELREIPGSIDERGGLHFDYRNVPSLYASAVAKPQKSKKSQPEKEKAPALDDLLNK